MKICVGEKFISGDVIQHRVAVLEVVEDTQDGAVVVVRSQRGHADVLQRDILTSVCGYEALDGELKVQNLVDQRSSEVTGSALHEVSANQQFIQSSKDQLQRKL